MIKETIKATLDASIVGVLGGSILAVTDDPFFYDLWSIANLAGPGGLLTYSEAEEIYFEAHRGTDFMCIEAKFCRSPCFITVPPIDQMPESLDWDSGFIEQIDKRKNWLSVEPSTHVAILHRRAPKSAKLHELGHLFHRHHLFPLWNDVKPLSENARKIIQSEIEASQWAIEHGADPALLAGALCTYLMQLEKLSRKQAFRKAAEIFEVDPIEYHYPPFRLMDRVEWAKGWFEKAQASSNWEEEISVG